MLDIIDKKQGYAALAPMAGVADRAFRELCKGYGAGYTVCEMVSAKAITMGDKKSDELMQFEKAETPCGIQLFGSNPDIIAKAAVYALKYSPDFIDINMGCPAPKIAKNGCGSALLKSPEKCGEIINAVKKAVNVPVTAKIRTGWDENSVNCTEVAQILEFNGADLITVHGRTTGRMYAPPADLDAIRAVKKSVKIPVVGNGDIYTPENALHMYEYTGCDYIMVGRGALGAPWIFKQINDYLAKGIYSPAPTAVQKMKIMLEHAKRICELKGEKAGMLELRKHALWYTKGLKGSAKLRNEFSNVSSPEQLYLLAEKVIEIDCE